MPDLLAARTNLVRLLTALHADGERLITLLCVATADLDAEQEAAFLEFCANLSRASFDARAGARARKGPATPQGPGPDQPVLRVRPSA